MNSASEKIITIDLNENFDPKALNRGNLLQWKAFDQLTELFERFLKAQEAVTGERPRICDEIDPVRVNQTIFISGPRGSGKTTFLRSVLTDIQDADKEPFSLTKPLTYIDPTLIETGEHLMVLLLTQINALLQDHWKNSLNEQQQMEYQERLAAMAEGLKQLGKENKPSESWEDASWAIKKGLKHAYGGKALELNFNRLLEIAANILDIKAFVIAFDDVDIDTTCADQVLELIRRYLTSPRLIVLVSGDLNLYSYLVTRKQFDELGGISNFQALDQPMPDLVQHLEQQYLLKLFPLHQRVELRLLKDICDKKSGCPTVKVSCRTDEEEVELTLFLKRKITQKLGLNDSDYEIFERFLLRQPVRTILQLLYCLNDPNITLSTVLADIFIGAFRSEGGDRDAFMSDDVHAIALHLFHLCFRYGELATGFYNRPNGNEGSYNAVQMLIAARVTETCSENPGTAIHYMLAGPGSCSMASFVGELVGDEKVLKQYLDYIGLTKNESSRHVAAHYTAILVPAIQNPKAPQLDAGVLRLRRNIPQNFNRDNLEKSLFAEYNLPKEGVSGPKLFSSMEKLLQNETIPELFKVSCASIHHQIVNPWGSVDYLSVYLLLASVGELLRHMDNPDTKKIKRTLQILTSTTGYPDPPFWRKERRDDQFYSEPEEDIDEAIVENFDLEHSATLIRKWLVTLNEQRENRNEWKISSLLLGKIWTRLYFSLSNVFSEKRSQLMTGQAMERAVWCLLNAFIVEESRYHDRNNWKNKVLRNPNKKPNELINNLKDVNFENLPLSRAIASCPLVWGFLDVGAGRSVIERLYEKIPEAKDLFDTVVDHLTEGDSTIYQLSKLPIIGTYLK